MRPLTRYWLLLLLLSTALTGLARAGGGGGGGGGHGGGGGSSGGGHSSGGFGGVAWHGSGNGSFAVVDAVLLVACAAVTAYYWRAGKTRQLAAEQLLARLAQEDALWNLKHLTARVSEVFFRVQAAWTANNQDLARDCLSERLYREHKQQTDALLARGQRNVLEDIKLTEVAVCGVADYLDNSRDTFAARVSGSMVDYTLNSPQSPLLAPGTLLPESFTEIWTFVRVENRWVLDRIAQAGGGGSLTQGLAYSEQTAGPAPPPPRRRKKPARNKTPRP